MTEKISLKLYPPFDVTKENAMARRKSSSSSSLPSSSASSSTTPRALSKKESEMASPPPPPALATLTTQPPPPPPPPPKPGTQTGSEPQTPLVGSPPPIMNSMGGVLQNRSLFAMRSLMISNIINCLRRGRCTGPQVFYLLRLFSSSGRNYTGLPSDLGNADLRRIQSCNSQSSKRKKIGRGKWITVSYPQDPRKVFRSKKMSGVAFRPQFGGCGSARKGGLSRRGNSNTRCNAGRPLRKSKGRSSRAVKSTSSAKGVVGCQRLNVLNSDRSISEPLKAWKHCLNGQYITMKKLANPVETPSGLCIGEQSNSRNIYLYQRANENSLPKFLFEELSGIGSRKNYYYEYRGSVFRIKDNKLNFYLLGPGTRRPMDEGILYDSKEQFDQIVNSATRQSIPRSPGGFGTRGRGEE